MVEHAAVNRVVVGSSPTSGAIPHPHQAAALARERQLKGWTRSKKLALAEGRLEDLKRLAKPKQKPT